MLSDESHEMEKSPLSVFSVSSVVIDFVYKLNKIGVFGHFHDTQETPLSIPTHQSLDHSHFRGGED